MTACQKKEVPSVTPSYTYTYNSSFSINQYYSVISNSLVLNGRKPSVTIYKTCPYQCSKAPMSVNVDSIYFNSVSLKITTNYYTLCISDTVPQNTFPPFAWKVKGTSEYPSFTEIVTDSLPKFTKFIQMPDSISKSNITILQLGGINADNVSLYIDNGLSAPPPNAIIGLFSCGAASVNSTSTTLTYDPSITSPSTCSLTVVYSKKYSKTINGKEIGFSVSSVYQKKIKFFN